MRQNAGKYVILLRTLTLALLFMGLLIITPGPVSADDPDSPLVDAPGRVGIGGSGLSGSGEIVDSGVSRSVAGSIIFTQPPIATTDQHWQAWTSASDTFEGNLLCIDDFWGLNDDIDDIHWYGLAMIWDDTNLKPGYILGDPAGMQFEIIFYQDNSGSPGAKVAEFSNISPSREYHATYQYDNIDYIAYRFDVTGLDVPAGLTKGWVSIQSTYSPSNSQFLWLISSSGNDNAMQLDDPNIPNEPFGNLSFALTKEPPAVPGISFWGSIIIVIFFSIIMVCLIRRRQIR
jgi:hypothetical protein